MDLGRPSQASAPRGSTRGAVAVAVAVAEGLRLVAGSRVLWTTQLVVGVAMFGLGAVNVLFLPLIVDVLAVNPVWLGRWNSPRAHR